MWLDPNNPESFPAGMLDALALRGAAGLEHTHRDWGESIQVRLRRQMQTDALQPLDGGGSNEALAGVEAFPSEVIDEAMQFLRLQVR